jgi:hypothetical protein
MTTTLLLALAISAADPCAEPRASPLGEIGSVSRERARVLEVAGLAPLRPRLFERWSSDPVLRVCDGGAPHPSELPALEPSRKLELSLAPVTLRAVGHRGWSDDRNDGALWAGKGLSSSASAGVALRWRWFSAQVAPIAAWQQNEAFRLRQTSATGLSPWSNPFAGGIDLPLRFGPDSFWTTHPGQSWIRADAWNVAVGLSTENLWWGPGMRDSIVMTNSAPGFLHAFLGTSRPADIWIGWLEAQAVWGRLRESDWFDADSENDRRLFTALTLGFEPKVVPGLFVGVARTFQFTIPPGGLELSDYVKPFFESPEKVNLGEEIDERGDNQLISFFARWAFQPVGFEVYGEWGRDDHAWDLADFATHPEHGQAWLLGAHKAWRGVRGGVLRVSTELVNTFEKPVPNPPRGVPVFYTHGIVRQGYTNEGQMLGAGLGPQGNSQSIAADWFGARHRLGLFAERRARHQRFFYDQVVPPGGGLMLQDVELGGDLRWTYSLRGFELDARLGAARRLNANFERHVSAPRGSATVTWTPGAL